MERSRRTFMKQAVGFTAAACYPGLDHAEAVRFSMATTANSVDESNAAGWYGRPMRWAQLAFVEDDPGNYDLAFWLDYFKRIHADAACLSAGGAVAFYPTKIPLHYRSKFLGD